MNDETTLDAVMAVMGAAFDPHWREAWTRTQVRDSLQMPSAFLMLGDEAGSVVTHAPASGFILSRQALDEEELLLIAVHPDMRGRGIGTRLLENYFAAARSRGARRIFLEMRANNPAHTLYSRAGFRPIGTRPRYYRAADGQAIDAITFARTLES